MKFLLNIPFYLAYEFCSWESCKMRLYSTSVQNVVKEITTSVHRCIITFVVNGFSTCIDKVINSSVNGDYFCKTIP